jgi:RND family efflux transporter MFP subunit
MSNVDLSQLAVSRQPTPTAKPLARRRWGTRYVVPGVILAAFGGLFATAMRDSLLPAQAVTVVPVFVTRADVQQEGTPLFQAAGWIEPQPSAVTASALASGVVEQMFVVEGQLVEKGNPIAKLNDADAKLALQQAEAKLRLAEADLQNAEATLTAAQAMLENPSELRVALADAESLLAETQLGLGNLPFAIEAAASRRKLAAESLARKEQAGDAVAGRITREAAAELAAAESALGELQARGPKLREQINALERKRDALRQQLELMTEPKRAVAAAEASLSAAKARHEQAHLEVDAARLNLERMTVVAPISGRILTVDARPGKRLSGLDPLSEQNSSAVASMYDPAQLQVRVDVRLEDVPQVQIGQPVTIETAASRQPLSGKVLWLTTRADIQKNTLQVKVAIDNPPAVITPEMLGKVTFLAPPQPVTEEQEIADSLRLLVPRQLVMEGDGGKFVWIADAANGVARRTAVELGKAGTDQLIEIAAGLDPTVKLVASRRESLSDGDRIRIVGNDQSLGGSSPSDGVSGVASPTARAAAPAVQ